MKMEQVEELERAWLWRERLGAFGQSEAVRVFHGPGEGSGDLQYFSMDRFGDHYWVTEWGSSFEKVREILSEFLMSRGAVSAVLLGRPKETKQGRVGESQPFLGQVPVGRWGVREGQNYFLIQFEKTRHPGLFLDHAPLRQWLGQNMHGMRVLNTFAYTGSLSVAAWRGGASDVTTLDLSKSSVQWAQENFKLNSGEEARSRWLVGDVFEWLPRFKRKGESFDCIILDPPSFAHGKKSHFSTAKNLVLLHELAMSLLNPEGVLVTSINSANITWPKYAQDVLAAAHTQKRKFKVVRQIDLPETFPTRFDQATSRYLKGWILQNRP